MILSINQTMLFRLAEVHRVLRNEISKRGKIHHSAKNYTERHKARGGKLFRGMSKHTLIFCADESGNVTQRLSSRCTNTEKSRHSSRKYL